MQKGGFISVLKGRVSSRRIQKKEPVFAGSFAAQAANSFHRN